MTLLRQYRFASFVLVIVAIIAFSIATLDFAQLFLAVVLAMASWYITEGPRGRSLPEWVANVLTIGVLGWCVMDFMRAGELSGATASLGRFLLWLLVIKLFVRRSKYEDRQRLALATMLVIAGCLESVQFAFGALVILFAALAIWTAMLWRLHAGYEHSRAMRLEAAGFAPPLEVALGRRAVPQFRGIATASVLFVFVMSAGVFVLFPRMPSAFDFRGRGGVRSTVGFSDEISLRGGDRISGSRRELFTIQWRGPDGEQVLPARPLLLRGAVLDRYDPASERWIAARNVTGIRTLRTPPNEGFIAVGGIGAVGSAGLDGSVTSAPASTARFEMRALATDVMFTLYAPVAVATQDARTVSFDPTTFLMRDASSNRASRYWSYELRIQQQPSAATLDDLAGGAEPPRALDMPVQELAPIAQEFLARARAEASLPPDPGPDAPAAERYVYKREAARAIAGLMKRNFTYTTDLSDIVKIPDEDPIVSFLSRYRRGHCEYFASGLCAVLRTLGIESRIVTGYIAMEYDDSAGFYVVRESNAHAWVEVRTGPAAWTAVDATPEDSLREIQEQNRSFADNFRWLYGSIEFLWNSRVVSYDSSTQAAIADRVQSSWRDAVGERLTALSDWMSSIATRLSLGAAGRAWFTAIAVCITAASLVPVVLALRRRRLRRALRLESVPKARRRMLLRDAAFYATALSELAKAGVPKPDHLTPQAYARELAERNPGAGQAFSEIVAVFYRIRFGGQPADPAQAARLEQCVFALRRALRQNPRG